MGEEEVMDLEEQQEVAEADDDIVPADESTDAPVDESTEESPPEPKPAPAKKQPAKKTAAKKQPLAKTDTGNALTKDIKRFGLGKWAIANIDPALAAEAITENIGSDGFNYRDLDQLTVPQGGSTIWEVPSIEGATPVKEFMTVILYWQSERRYWRDAKPQGLPPDCMSLDAKQGSGNPGGMCATCPMAKFGTKVHEDGSTGRGQACKLVMSTFLLRSNELIPMRFAIPVTSIDPMRKFFLRLASRGIKYWEVVTKLALEKDKSRDGWEFAKIVPTLVGMLSSEYIQRVNSFRDGLMSVLTSTRVSDSIFTGDEDEAADIEEGVEL